MTSSEIANSNVNAWTIGAIRIERVPYFDVGLPAESIHLEGVAEAIDWAGPWVIDGQPAVGQAFWLIRSGVQTIVVDPCGASDVFLRSGPDAVDHQAAAFGLLEAAGCHPDSVDTLVLTHLDGIGMAALADGAAAGEETWTPAFPRAELIISQTEYDHIMSGATGHASGGRAFRQLDAQGVVRPVPTPFELAPGVTLRFTGAHSPGHCCVDIASDGDRAVMLGHLAISPLHAAAGVTMDHDDRQEAWAQLQLILDECARDGVLVAGALWPAPGAAWVRATNPYRLVPAD